jgi:ATP-dependent DNA helicase RecG
VLDDTELERRLLDLESDLVERKRALTHPDTVRQAICAFANDLPGHAQPGVVFVGANDDGSSAGLEITDELLRNLAMMRDDGAIQPFPSIAVQRRTLAGGDVARRAQATPEEERRLAERRRANDLPFDVRAWPDAPLDALDTDFFRRAYLPFAVAADVLAANRRSVTDQLRSLRMLAPDGHPTTLGLLVLGTDPRAWLPGAYIQFLRIDGLALTDPLLDQKQIDGPLLDVVQRLDDVLRTNITIETALDEGPVEVRRPDYPLDALQQLTRNALMHRTYDGTHAPVRVYWFRDRVEILSPGGPYGQVSIEAFGRPGVTDYRNPHLAEAMRVLGFVQRFGVGIALAREALRANGNPELVLDAQANFVLATVRSRL